MHYYLNSDKLTDYPNLFLIRFSFESRVFVLVWGCHPKFLVDTRVNWASLFAKLQIYSSHVPKIKWNLDNFLHSKTANDQIFDYHKQLFPYFGPFLQHLGTFCYHWIYFTCISYVDIGLWKDAHAQWFP